jgi:hypothetical protein
VQPILDDLTDALLQASEPLGQAQRLWVEDHTGRISGAGGPGGRADWGFVTSAVAARI